MVTGGALMVYVLCASRTDSSLQIYPSPIRSLRDGQLLEDAPEERLRIAVEARRQRRGLAGRSIGLRRSVQRHDARLRPAGLHADEGGRARLPEARPAGRAGVEEQGLLAPLNRRFVAVTADHEVEALAHGVATSHEAGPDVADDDPQAGDLDLGIPGQVQRREGRVGVAGHRREWRQAAQPFENAVVADVAGVHDARRAGEQVVEHGVVVAVRVAQHADEGRLAHVCRIQAHGYYDSMLDDLFA